jgi:WD40 repeat protein
MRHRSADAHVIGKHDAAVRALAVIESGLFVSASDDCKVQLWRLAPTGKLDPGTARMPMFVGDAPIWSLAVHHLQDDDGSGMDNILIVAGDANGARHVLRLMDRQPP